MHLVIVGYGTIRRMSNIKHHKKSELVRFIVVVLIIAAYAGYTVSSYGLEQGIGVAALTWAFFVFATPIADGGFVVAFPIRLITGFRMLYTQILIWIFGALLVAGYLIYSAGTFHKTALLQLFYDILVTPWPLGIILVLSAVGTFVSIKFDDDVVDVATAKHKKYALKKRHLNLYISIAIFIVTIILYIILLKVTGTNIGLA